MGLIRNTPLPILRAGGCAWHRLRAFGAATGQRRHLILTYHDVGDGIPADLFARQMEHLSTVAAVVPLDTLLEGARTGGIAQGIACAIPCRSGGCGSCFMRSRWKRVAAPAHDSRNHDRKRHCRRLRNGVAGHRLPSSAFRRGAF